jgi:hypothetical protein
MVSDVSFHGHLGLLLWAYGEIMSEMSGWALVAHACNPSFSGGRDQEDHSSKPSPGKQFRRPYLKNTHHTKGLAEWLKKSSSPSTTKK